MLKASEAMTLLSSVGFKPKPELDPKYVEFFKDYSLDGTGIVRVTLQVGRHNMVGINKGSISSIIVTTQRFISPDQEAVLHDAPFVCHRDLAFILNAFDAESKPIQVAEPCGQCGKMLTDFVRSEIDGSIYCPNFILTGEECDDIE